MSNENTLKDLALEILHVIATDGAYTDAEMILETLRGVDVSEDDLDYHYTRYVGSSKDGLPRFTETA